jgi:hypothetical protein
VRRKKPESKVSERVLAIGPDDLTAPDDAIGAMVCDYATFKSFYRIRARSAIRNEPDSVIASLRVKYNSKTAEADIRKTANHIGTAIANNLRRDDVVTGFDTSQYYLLLSKTTVADAERVIGRLVESIRGATGVDFMVETAVERILPLSGDGAP